jgi:hypothetical protein
MTHDQSATASDLHGLLADINALGMVTHDSQEGRDGTPSCG